MRRGFAGCADRFRPNSSRKLSILFSLGVSLCRITVNAVGRHPSSGIPCPVFTRVNGIGKWIVRLASETARKEDPETDVNQLRALYLVPSQQRTEEREH